MDERNGGRHANNRDIWGNNINPSLRTGRSEQPGEARAEYASKQFGRGFDNRNLWKMRAVYLYLAKRANCLDTVETI